MKLTADREYKFHAWLKQIYLSRVGNLFISFPLLIFLIDFVSLRDTELNKIKRIFKYIPGCLLQLHWLTQGCNIG